MAENQRIAGLVQEIHRGSPDKAYRRIRDDLEHYYHTPINDAAYLPQPGDPVYDKTRPLRLYRVVVLPAASGGEHTEPTGLRGPF